MTIPTEAREGLSRAWLEILKEKHPGITWVTVSGQELQPMQSLAAEDDLSVAA